MQSNRLKFNRFRLVWVLLVALVLSGCHSLGNRSAFDHSSKMGANPRVEVTLAPTYTPTAEAEPAALPTATPTDSPVVAPTQTPTESAAAIVATLPAAEEATATATRPAATATARAASARPTVAPTPQPTPIVVIPSGFTVQTDSTRGYSLALPRGYTLLDLRSAQFRNLANALGMGGQMTTLNEFLDSPAGQSVGILAASDLTGMIFGGLPTIAQVMVVNAQGASQETAQVSIESLLSGQGGFLSNPVIETIENVTINNLPGVQATVTGTMAGANRAMAGKVVGLLANDKFYVLVQLTEATKRADKEPIFDQIIGTFRPQ